MKLLIVLLVVVGSVFGRGLPVYKGLPSLIAEHGGLFPMQSGRVVGGNPIPIENHPYTASVQYLGAHRCGGTIINNHCVITTAQCTLNVPDADITVRVGSSTSQTGGQLLPIVFVDVHASFDPITFNSNVAVIHISGHLHFGGAVAAIAMPAQGAGVPAGALATVTGWGSIAEGGAFSPILQYVQVPVITNAECNALYGGGITDGMICAGFPQGGADACEGDGGGPLTFGNQVIGLVSFGEGCGRPNLPGVYTRVAYYRDWIDHHAIDH